MSNKPVKIILVGAGSRGMQYSAHALKHPDEMEIIAVVDPSDVRRNRAASVYGISEKRCFKTVEDAIAAKFPYDGVINSTMDEIHVQTSIPFLKEKKTVLLEKPMCQNSKDLYTLYNTAIENDAKIMVCHVLRYTPFYSAIKKRVLAGDIGEIKSIQTQENISYHHMTAAFIRGKWGNSDICGSKIMMAKCCHDLDLLTWYKSGIRPVSVVSMGELFQYKPEKAPEGCGEKCLVDCKYEHDCPYSSKLHYITKDGWDVYAWRYLEDNKLPWTMENKMNSLKGDNPFAKCVYKCGTNNEDVQSVVVKFEDGCIATHTLVGGTAKPCRTIHLIGTKGELLGEFEEGSYSIKTPSFDSVRDFDEESVKLGVSLEGHGGGDKRIMADFVKLIHGNETSISCTKIEDSMYGHFIGFASEESMNDEKFVKIPKLR